jgi:hypothetical protein
MTLIHQRSYRKLEKRWAESHAEVLKRHFDTALQYLSDAEEQASQEAD